MNTFRNFMGVYRNAQRSKGLRTAIALQEIESNPLSDDDIAVVERLDAQNLTPEERAAEVAASIERDFGIRRAV